MGSQTLQNRDFLLKKYLFFLRFSLKRRLCHAEKPFFAYVNKNYAFVTHAFLIVPWACMRSHVQLTTLWFAPPVSHMFCHVFWWNSEIIHQTKNDIQKIKRKIIERKTNKKKGWYVWWLTVTMRFRVLLKRSGMLTEIFC